jgi:hypothetical protein
MEWPQEGPPYGCGGKLDVHGHCGCLPGGEGMTLSLILLLWVCAAVYSVALFALFTGKVTREVLLMSVALAPLAVMWWSVLALSEASENAAAGRRK